MINFLKCEAKAVIKLILDVAFQDKGVTHELIEVNTDNVYKITVADNNYGIKTLNGRIVSFTICPEREVLSFVNQNTRPFVVDTITIDCSDDRTSNICTVNVSDIRSVEEICDSGFEEINRKDIATFK